MRISDNIASLTLTSEIDTSKDDTGFSFKIGDTALLKDKIIKLYINGPLQFRLCGLNLGASWGNKTYRDMNYVSTIHYFDNYTIFEIDFNKVLLYLETDIEKSGNFDPGAYENYTGDVYCMIYGVNHWPNIEEHYGETMNVSYSLCDNNGYGNTVYTNAPDPGLISINTIKPGNTRYSVGCYNNMIKYKFGDSSSIKGDSGFSVIMGDLSNFIDNIIVIRNTCPNVDTPLLDTVGFKLSDTDVWSGQYVEITNKDSYACIKMDNFYIIDVAEASRLFMKKYPDATSTRIVLMMFGNTSWPTTINFPVSGFYNFFISNNKAFITNKFYNKEILSLSNKITDISNDYLSFIEDTAQSNVLYGKKYIACGDSFTQGDFTGFVDAEGKSGKNSPLLYDSEMKYYKTYPWWIAKRNNMTLVNEALCGSIVALDKTYVADPSSVAISLRSPFSYQRYLNIPEDADYVTFWFGINDAGHTNIGNIDDNTNETFYGAWNVVFEWLLTNRPYTKLGMIITNGSTEAYRQAERDISIKWGIPYLDMVGDNGVPVIFGAGREGMCSKAITLRNNAFKVTASNSHPNIQAHEYQSTFIEQFLRSL